MSVRPAVWLVLCGACARASGGGGGDGDGDVSDGGDDEPPLGTCADGFVRCAGLCVEAALAGDGCAPVACAGPASAEPSGLGPRGFAHRLELVDGAAVLTVTTGAASGPLTGTVGIDVHYRRGGGPLERAALTGAGGTWTATLPGVAGERVSYYLTQRFAPNTFHPASPGTEPTVDSAWFHRTLGEPVPAAPAGPLTVAVAARFRDRHRNEWRYDHYVAGYDGGATFGLTIVDRGDALDITIAPDPDRHVGKVDLKWYDVFGTTPFCGDPPALAGLAIPDPGMARDGDVFRATIPGVVPGQLVDFELTLTNLPGTVVTYYTEWFHYRVGTGRLGHHHQHPWAYAAGDAAVADVTVDQFAYAQHVADASPRTLEDFVAGKLVFDTDVETGMLVNPPTTFDCRGTQPLVQAPAASPLAARLAGALGPHFDTPSCAGCHRLDGRGAPPELATDTSSSIIVRLAPAHPTYGDQLTHRATAGTAPEGRLRVDWEDVPGEYADGTAYTLRRPRWSIDGLATPLGDSAISVRIAPPAFGLGLVEAVPEATLRGLADPDDADHDGISGRPGAGRFGWKATQPTLAAQAAAAFEGDLGVTGDELDDALLDDVTAYLRALSVPPRDNYDDPSAIRGKALFEAARCTACHVPSLITAVEPPLPELAAQVIQPFSDFLLHDLGDGLADPGPDGAEWRTAPLWGLGFADHAIGEADDPTDPNRPTGEARYLHDGRARTILEAILWHGGEAEAARDAVRAMNAGERADLVAYTRYPFADPPSLVCP